jgi:hypothetical protein
MIRLLNDALLMAAELQKTLESAIPIDSQKIQDQVASEQDEIWCTDRKGSVVTQKKNVPRKQVNKKVNVKSSVRATCPNCGAAAKHNLSINHPALVVCRTSFRLSNCE